MLLIWNSDFQISASVSWRDVRTEGRGRMGLRLEECQGWGSGQELSDQNEHSPQR